MLRRTPIELEQGENRALIRTFLLEGEDPRVTGKTSALRRSKHITTS